MAVVSVAHADYVWSGPNSITTDGWKDKDNWTLTSGSVWKDGTNGPGITNSNMWDKIVISGASSAGAIGDENGFRIEGWGLKMELKDSSKLTFDRVYKFQNGCEITIDSTSALTFNTFYDGNDGGVITLNNAGEFNLGYSIRQQGGDGFEMNLYDTGVVNLFQQNGNGNNRAKVASVEAQLVSTVPGIQTRKLITMEGSRMDFSHVLIDDPNSDDDSVKIETDTYETTTYKFTDVNGQEMTAVNSMEALLTATAPAYYVTKSRTGISVSYTYGLNVPEPTTATLSLLALCGLAARRRRASR